jgi:uncharacterized low-complexity protein
MNKFSRKPLAIALGAAFALSGIAVAQASVFQTADLGSGYMVAAAEATMPAPADAMPAAPAPAKKHRHHKKAAEKKCGGSNCEKGVKNGECACGASMGKKADGKCGEHKCGEKKAAGEGKCGEKKGAAPAPAAEAPKM